MSEDVTVNLIRTLVENLENAPEQWVSLAMVLGFDTTKVYRTFGFA